MNVIKYFNNNYQRYNFFTLGRNELQKNKYKRFILIQKNKRFLFDQEIKQNSL